jgi:hypothetical protein
MKSSNTNSDLLAGSKAGQAKKPRKKCVGIPTIKSLHQIRFLARVSTNSAACSPRTNSFSQNMPGQQKASGGGPPFVISTKYVGPEPNQNPSIPVPRQIEEPPAEQQMPLQSKADTRINIHLANPPPASNPRTEESSGKFKDTVMNLEALEKEWTAFKEEQQRTSRSPATRLTSLQKKTLALPAGASLMTSSVSSSQQLNPGQISPQPNLLLCGPQTLNLPVQTPNQSAGGTVLSQNNIGLGLMSSSIIKKVVPYSKINLANMYKQDSLNKLLDTSGDSERSHSNPKDLKHFQNICDKYSNIYKKTSGNVLTLSMSGKLSLR